MASPGQNFGFWLHSPHGSRKSKKCKGPWKWLREKERASQNRQFWCFCGVPPFTRSGYCKIDNFGAFAGFPPFRRTWKPEIQEIQGAFEMASGKAAGIAKSTILMLLWCSPHFGGLGSRKSKKSKEPWKWPPEKERGNPTNTKSLENCFRQRSGYCKIDNFGAFVVLPPFFFRRPWGPIANSTILVVLWGSPHFGGLGSRKSKKYKGPWMHFVLLDLMLIQFRKCKTLSQNTRIVRNKFRP